MRRHLPIVYVLLLVLLVGVAGFLRFERLAEKPMHTDEAVQAYKVAQLLTGSGYVYDPVDHHGPAMYYLAAGVCRLAGETSFARMTEESLRSLPAFFGLLLALTPLLWGKCGVRRKVIFVTVALAVASPMAVYYARYFIQETLFVCCFWAALPLCWRLWRHPDDSPRRRWGLAVAAGALLGLAVALKETWVLMAAATGTAGLLVAWRSKGNFSGGEGFFWRRQTPWLGLAVALLVVTGLFYSSFGSHPRGVIDAVTAYAGYWGKTSGGPHDKSFGWYFQVLFGSKFGLRELLTGLGCLLLLPQLWGRTIRDAEERAVAWFALLSGGILYVLYSLIAYKTPWLLLGVLPPLWLAAGFGYAGLWQHFARRRIPAWVGAGLCLVGVFYLGRSARFFAHRFATDERNPMAYVHATGEMERVRELAGRLAAVADPESFKIQVFAEEYWPLPWYFRAWRSEFFPPLTPDPAVPVNAALVITDAHWEPVVAGQADVPYVHDFVGLRPNVLLQMRVREDLLQRSIAQRSGKPNE